MQSTRFVELEVVIALAQWGFFASAWDALYPCSILAKGAGEKFLSVLFGSLMKFFACEVSDAGFLDKY